MSKLLVTSHMDALPESIAFNWGDPFLENNGVTQMGYVVTDMGNGSGRPFLFLRGDEIKQTFNYKDPFSNQFHEFPVKRYDVSLATESKKILDEVRSTSLAQKPLNVTYKILSEINLHPHFRGPTATDMKLYKCDKYLEFTLIPTTINGIELQPTPSHEGLLSWWLTDYAILLQERLPLEECQKRFPH